MKFLIFAAIVIAAVFFSGCTGTDVVSPSSPSTSGGAPGAAPAGAVVVPFNVSGVEENATLNIIDENTTEFKTNNTVELRYQYPGDFYTNCSSTDFTRTILMQFPEIGQPLSKAECRNKTYHYVEYMDPVHKSPWGLYYWVKVDGGM